MIASDVGDFEVDVSKDGQTREHAVLPTTMGVNEMIDCMNKMDKSPVSYFQFRCEEIKNELATFFKKFGYNPFVPISSQFNANMVEASRNMP